MKYADTKVVFREVPDEVTLAVNISGCPVCCPGCHSSYLTQDIGEELNVESLNKLILSQPGISCVSFMGGDADPLYLKDLVKWIHSAFPGLKVSWYSGRPLEVAERYGMTDVLDFIKVGPFLDEAGPLDSETTNQRFYRIERSSDETSLTDWTYRFRKKIT